MVKKLKDIRIKNNYTFQQMADLLGISKAFYWQIENNKRTLTYKMAVKIANIYEVKPDDLFYEQYTKEKEN